MGSCIYCGESAGFLRRKHKKCGQKHEQGKSEVISLVSQVNYEDIDFGRLERSIKEIAQNSFIDSGLLIKLVVSGWESAVELAFDDGLLSEQKETVLNELKEYFDLSEQSLDRAGSYSKMVKGAILRDITNGKLPEQVEVSGNLPFNLQKAEKIIWLFQDVKYYEEKSRTKYVGGSKGVSFRIAKGVYYRTGGFKGERVKTSETIHADTGFLGVTNKHMYFSGPSKKFRIAFNKIVAFEPFSDGIGVQRDAQTAKPQIFETGDGWFTYNLIANLAQM